VIVVHRDSPEAAARAVAAFENQGLSVRTVVVDSGSSPRSVAALRAGLAALGDGAGHGAEVIELGANVGFGPAANAGLRRWLATSRSEWAVVAPHDVEPAPDCLSCLIGAVAERPRAGLVSAEYGPEFSLRPVVDKFLGGSYARSARGQGWEAVDYPHGTLLAIRRAAALDIGLFDERFFAYCEEADLGIRARAAGWEVGVVWGAVVTNGRLPDETLSRYLQLRNTLLLLREHFGPGRMRVRLAWELAALAFSRRRARSDPATARRRQATRLAIADYRAGRFGPPPAALAGNIASSTAPHTA